MIKIDEKMLENIKKEAIDTFVPILRDETMKVIEQKLDEIKPKKILELGTAVGYSAIKFAKHLENDASIDTIERNEKRYIKAKENVQKMGLDSTINIIFGDATYVMKNMTRDNYYDVIFIDAAKGQYLNFLDEAKRLVKSGGYIIADNVLFHGLVNSDYNGHRNRTAVTRLRKFLEIIENDLCFESKVYDIDDGFAIIKVNKS